MADAINYTFSNDLETELKYFEFTRKFIFDLAQFGWNAFVVETEIITVGSDLEL